MNGTDEAGRPGTIPAAAIAAVHRGVTATCGGAEAARVLRQIGLEAAPALNEGFADWLARRSGDGTSPASLAPADFWTALNDFFVAIGMGSIEQKELHAGILAVSSAAWVESDTTNSEHPGCHITTGLLAGLLREVAGQDLAALEVECRGAGDGQCRFLIGSATALDLLYEEMQRGSGYAYAVAALA